jgi:hypothetical protein
MSREPKLPHDEADEREWALQERAARAERLGLDSSDDETLMRYRAVAHALRQSPQEALPDDFAQRVAARAMRTGMASMKLELCLSLVLTGALVGLLVMLALKYGATWTRLVQALTPLREWITPWTLALAACLILSAALDGFVHARRMARH